MLTLEEIDKIENFLKCNIYIFACDKKFNCKKIIRKSLKNYDKNLDLLLIDNINHYISNKRY